MACNPIQAIRLSLNMTQAELGKLVGVSVRTVSSWETWRKLPSPDKLDALRSVLHLSETDVFRCTHKPAIKVKSERRIPIW